MKIICVSFYKIGMKIIQKLQQMQKNAFIIFKF